MGVIDSLSGILKANSQNNPSINNSSVNNTSGSSTININGANSEGLVGSVGDGFEHSSPESEEISRGEAALSSDNADEVKSASDGLDSMDADSTAAVTAANGIVAGAEAGAASAGAAADSAAVGVDAAGKAQGAAQGNVDAANGAVSEHPGGNRHQDFGCDCRKDGRRVLSCHGQQKAGRSV